MRSMRGMMERVRCVGVAMGMACVCAVGVPTLASPTSAFVYQGRLDRDGVAYTGPATVVIRVYEQFAASESVASSGAIPVDVVDGLFSFEADLGTAHLLHPARFYQVFVRTPDMTEFQPFSPQTWRSAPTAGAAYRAMTLDPISTSADPFPVRLSSQDDASDFEAGNRHWQAFRSESGGLLTQIALQARGLFPNADATLRIYEGQGQGGRLLHTQKVFIPAQGEVLLNLVPGVLLQGNRFYTWDLEAAPGPTIGLARSTEDVDPFTVSSVSGSDFAYTTFIGDEGEMSLRATRLGVNEGDPRATLHVTSDDLEVARFESSSTSGSGIALRSNSLRSYQIVNTGPANPGGEGRLRTSSPQGGAFTSLTATGFGINTETTFAALHVVSGESPEAVEILSTSPSATNVTIKNGSVLSTWNLSANGQQSTDGPGSFTVSNGTTRMVLSANGRVGIGTVPATVLHVASGVDATLGGGGFFQTGLSTAANIVMDDNEILARNNGAAAPLFLNAEGGGVVFGGATPAQATVHVQSGGNLSQSQSGFVQLGSSNATNLSLDTNEVQVLNNGTPASLFLNFRGGTVFVGDTANQIGGNAMQVNGNALKPGGGLWGSLSDARAKKDIKPMQGTLDRVLSLHGYTFEYTDDALAQGGVLRGEQIGLLAQEVQRVFPEWVYEDDKGRLNVSERGITALMVESLRDLREEKDAGDAALREALRAAEERVRTLEVENELMRARLERIEAVLDGRR